MKLGKIEKIAKLNGDRITLGHPSKNKTLVKVLQNYANAVIKGFLSQPILFNFFTLLRTVFPRWWVISKKNEKQSVTAQ